MCLVNAVGTPNAIVSENNKLETSRPKDLSAQDTYVLPPFSIFTPLSVDMHSSILALSTFLAAVVAAACSYLFYLLVIWPRRNPLSRLPGPPVRNFFGNHLAAVLEYVYPPLLYFRRAKSSFHNPDMPFTVLRDPPEYTRSSSRIMGETCGYVVCSQ